MPSTSARNAVTPTSTRVLQSEMSLTVTPPVGYELLVVVSSEKPLFAAARPDTESYREFLSALRGEQRLFRRDDHQELVADRRRDGERDLPALGIADGRRFRRKRHLRRVGFVDRRVERQPDFAGRPRGERDVDGVDLVH